MRSESKAGVLNRLRILPCGQDGVQGGRGQDGEHRVGGTWVEHKVGVVWVEHRVGVAWVESRVGAVHCVAEGNVPQAE